MELPEKVTLDDLFNKSEKRPYKEKNTPDYIESVTSDPQGITPREHHDDNTLYKVWDGLKAAKLTDEQATDAITQMQNNGILFRERR